MQKEFLNFGLEPYHFPVEQSHNYIINYYRMIQNYNDLTDANDVNVDYTNQLTKLGDISVNSLIYPSIFLFIGKESLSKFIVDGIKYTISKPSHLNKYGCANIEFQRSGPLFLSEERYERLIKFYFVTSQMNLNH